MDYLVKSPLRSAARGTALDRHRRGEEHSSRLTCTLRGEFSEIVFGCGVATSRRTVIANDPFSASRRRHSERSKERHNVTEQASFFVRDGQTFAPTGLAISPWNENAQMGVALSGLVAHVIDSVPTSLPMQVARLTIDILGAAPLEPLSPVVDVVREGRRIQLINVSLQAAGRTWVRASALRVRTGQSLVQAAPLTRPLPSVEQAPTGNTRWAETLIVEGDHFTPGPGARWVRFTSPVVSQAPLSPLERVAMIADFGSGIAPLVSPREYTFANLDISLHLTRLPRTDWLLIDAAAESSGNGIGVVKSQLGDEEGMIGHAHQTLFLEPRQRP